MESVVCTGIRKSFQALGKITFMFKLNSIVIAVHHLSA